jgi:glycosyltransferase involved in cell wall biosynthesis
MKILMLTPYLPYPLLSGGQIRTYNLLKNLKDKHEITLFSLIKDDSEKQYLPQLKKFCRKVFLLKRTKNPWAPKNILLAGLTPYPFLVTRNMPIHASKLIKKELAKNDYDLIHAETFYMMPNIPKTNIPTLLVEQTIEYLGYLSYVKKSRIWPIKPLLYIDIAKIHYWEKFFWQKAQKLVTMSQEDKSYIKKEVQKNLDIDIVANGVDIEFFQKTEKKLPKDPTILFVGTFKWLPNVDAVTFLVEEIWPYILDKLPNAKLHIVGFSPNKKIVSYGNQPSITISGDIKDIRKAFSTAHVLLSPVRSGKGTRFKVLEAMATNTPVVATPLCVEGLDVKPGVHALVSNTASGLASQTVKLLKDENLQKSLAKNGRQLVENKYGWNAISNELDRIYQ